MELTKHQRYNLKHPPIATRFDLNTKLAIMKAVKKEGLSRSNLIFKIVKDWLKQKGYIKVTEEVV